MMKNVTIYLVYGFFFMSAWPTEVPSLQNITLKYFSYKIPLEQPEIESISNSLSGFSDAAKHSFGAEIMRRWSQEKSLFNGHTKPSRNDIVTCVGPYLFHNSNLYLLKDSRYHRVVTDTGDFNLAFSSFSGYAYNDNYLMVTTNGEYASGNAFIFDPINNKVMQYSKVNDLGIRTVCSNNELDTFYIIRYGLHSETINNAYLNSFKDFYVPATFRQPINIPVEARSFKSSELDHHFRIVKLHNAFLMGNCNECVLSVKDHKAYRFPYCAFGLVASNDGRYGAINGIKNTEMSPRPIYIFIIKESSTAELVEINLGIKVEVSAMCFIKLLQKPYLIVIMHQDTPGQSLDLYECETGKYRNSLEIPFSAKKIWTDKEKLMIQSVDNDVIAYPPWLLENMYSLIP